MDKERERQIHEAIDKMAEAGADMNDLVIITSLSDFKPVPKHKHVFRSAYGELSVEYDQMLPPNTLHITKQRERGDTDD